MLIQNDIFFLFVDLHHIALQPLSGSLHLARRNEFQHIFVYLFGVVDADHQHLVLYLLHQLTTLLQR
jgi:hypothetical protein